MNQLIMRIYSLLALLHIRWILENQAVVLYTAFVILVKIHLILK